MFIRKRNTRFLSSAMASNAWSGWSPPPPFPPLPSLSLLISPTRISLSTFDRSSRAFINTALRWSSFGDRRSPSLIAIFGNVCEHRTIGDLYCICSEISVETSSLATTQHDFTGITSRLHLIVWDENFQPESKVEQIAEETDSLKKALDKYQNRQHRRQLEAKERAELFQRTKGDVSEGARILHVYDEEMQALQSAKNSSRMLEEAYATGAAVLVKYADQRESLKHAQRKALDILNTVGLSNSVLKLIEKRHRVDKWISYIGMVMTVVIVFGVWFWLR